MRALYEIKEKNIKYDDVVEVIAFGGLFMSLCLVRLPDGAVKVVRRNKLKFL